VGESVKEPWLYYTYALSQLYLNDIDNRTFMRR